MTPWSVPIAPPSRLRRVRLWVDAHPSICALALGCLLALAISALPAGARHGHVGKAHLEARIGQPAAIAASLP